MHYEQVKGILSASNGMNLYRGCQHGCIYCDARSRCYQMNHAFEDIAVKENALRLLERALKGKHRPCMIGTGAMSDPYIPLEEELGLMRRSLELIEKYGFGVTVQTKSDRILRDLELYRRIHEKTKAVVQMTLTTCDEDLCRIVEPGVCRTQRRVEVLKTFRDAGRNFLRGNAGHIAIHIDSRFLQAVSQIQLCILTSLSDFITVVSKPCAALHNNILINCKVKNITLT